MQALIHAVANSNVRISTKWINSNNLENDHFENEIKELDGILVPGGFGSSGVEGKINAIKYARENSIPYLGLCYGMQLAIIEFARNVLGLNDANSNEINKDTKNPVIDIIPSQKSFLEEKDYGATMRLGSYEASLLDSTLVKSLYEKYGKIKINNTISERHRHRYEVSPNYTSLLESAGMKISGFHVRSDGTKLVEFIELPSHKFFVATQFHPEFKSRLESPAPLFLGFVKACLSKKQISEDLGGK